jgi:putative flippase GtrA
MLLKSTLKLMRHKHVKLIVRHGMVSVFCGAVDFSLFMFLFKVNEFSLFFSYIISFAVATSAGFFAHSLFTFKVKGFPLKNAALFFIQALMALSLGYMVIFLLIKFGCYASISKALQLFSTFFFNVSFGKFISFKNRNSLIGRI